MRGEHLTAHQLAVQILELADHGVDANLEFLAHWMLGFTHTHLGEFDVAREHLEIALELYEGNQDDSLTFLYGQNPKVMCLNYLAIYLWLLGFLDQAVTRCEEAVNFAENQSHLYSQAFAHGMAALFHSLRRDHKSAQFHSVKAYKLAKKSRFPFFLALGMIIRGWERVQSGKTGMALTLVKNGIDAMKAIGSELGSPYFYSLLAEVYRIENESLQAVNQIECALEKSESMHELWYAAELNCIMGNLLEIQGLPEVEIFSRYWQEIEIAQRQEAKTLELQTAVALVKFDDTGVSPYEGRRVLEEVIRWFEEGLEEPLLVGAKALADQIT